MEAIRKIFVLMWQFLFATLTAYSQATTITGYIYEGKEPIFAANVFLAQHRGLNAITDEKGFFTLNVADSIDTDTLIVSYLGYNEYKMPLTDKKKDYIILLTPKQNATTLSEVVVKANIIASKEFAVSQIDKTSIYMTPAAGADPLRAVALQSYSTSTDESANPQLRGSYGNYSRVIINGVPIKNPVRNQQLNGIGNFSLFSADIVGRQFVYPSNPPLEYGNSIGGIVALNTTDYLLERHETNLSLSLANIGIFHATQINNKSFIQVYGNKQISEPYKWLNCSSLDYLNHFASTDCGLNYRTTLSKKSYINGYAYVVKETYQAERGMFNNYSIQNAKNIRNFNILNYRLHTDYGVWGINAAYDMSNSNYYYGAVSDTTEQKNVFISTSYKYYFPKGLTISLGVDYEYYLYHNHGVYPNTISEIGDTTSVHCSKGSSIYNKFETYIYGKWQYRNFIFGASIRKIYQIHAKPRWSYQANIKYKITDNNSLIASLGQYNSLSLPSYFVPQIANATSKQISLDWKCNLNTECEINAALYWKKENLPLYLVNGTGYQNVDNQIYGIEICGKYTWPYFEIYSSYSFLYSKMKYQEKMFPTDNSFRNMAKIMISYLNTKILNVSLSGLYRGGLPYTPIVSQNGSPIFGNINSERYNNYFTLDLSINRLFRIGKVGIVLFTTITNITNHTNQQYCYYNKDYTQRFVKSYNKRLLYVGCNVRL